ncbi:hypothetical protein BC827DRAFT_939382 [Russula dissimulans]|nr:hypothetical protein BC827DRAFT_939382 [Russula dissimulans]
MVSRMLSVPRTRSRLPQLTHARKVFLPVSSLLNPCQCNDVCNCGCRTSSGAEPLDSNGEFASETGVLSSNGNNSSSAPASSDGLETLARAAAAVLFSSLTPRNPPPIQPKQIASFQGQEVDVHVSLRSSRRPSEGANPASPGPTPAPALALPPLLFPEVPSPTPVVPPFSTFTTLAGSGCTCGLTCQCPDCATHHPRSDVEPSDAQDCSSCIDQTLHVIDRSGSGGFHIQSPVLERFFADAKRVPPPPTLGGKPVELPKLCCGGSCNCGGACGCGSDCGGCCQDTESNETHEDSRSDSIVQ